MIHTIQVSIFLAFFAGIFSVSAHAESNPFEKGVAKYQTLGGIQGGGGDTSIEPTIDEVRVQLLEFYQNHGAEQLNFKVDDNFRKLTAQDIENGNSDKNVWSMLLVLKKGAVHLKVIHKNEQNINIELQNTFVNNDKKICKGILQAKIDQLAYIICEYESFKQLAQDQMIQQVNHEYASLAGIERNVGSDSDYWFSRQLVKFGTNQYIKKVAIGLKNDGQSMEFKKIEAKGKTFETYRNIFKNGMLTGFSKVRVQIKDNFEIQTTPVTQSQWIDVMRYNDSHFRYGKGSNGEYGGYFPNRPVENVSYVQICGPDEFTGEKNVYGGDIAKFLLPNEDHVHACGKTKSISFVYHMNQLNDGCEYRLPTADEYDYVLLSGIENFDDAIKALTKNLPEQAKIYSESTADDEIETYDVKSYKPNALGIYDMIGNVVHFVASRAVVASSVMKDFGDTEALHQYQEDQQSASDTYSALNYQVSKGTVLKSANSLNIQSLLGEHLMKMMPSEASVPMNFIRSEFLGFRLVRVCK